MTQNPIKGDLVFFFEQYKLYVQSADNISRRRQYTNQYYTSLTVALISIPSTLNIKILAEPNILSIAIVIIGCILCLIWRGNLQSYRQLNASKFQVIFEMEKELTFHCFEKEWTILKNEKSKINYIDLTTLEKTIPLLMMAVYLLLLGHILWKIT